jgi:hypothetical protein
LMVMGESEHVPFPITEDSVSKPGSDQVFWCALFPQPCCSERPDRVAGCLLRSDQELVQRTRSDQVF